MLIDAHSHLDRYDLVGEGALESALEELTRHRIFTISNSMDLPSYGRNLEISETCDLVLPTFGVHPWNAPEYADRLEDLSEAIEQSPMIGEIGLDFCSARLKSLLRTTPCQQVSSLAHWQEKLNHWECTKISAS